VSVLQPIEALDFSGVDIFQVDGARQHYFIIKVWCSREEARILASSYSCTCHIFFATYVVLMVWSNHGDNIVHFCYLSLIVMTDYKKYKIGI
jgi:hypothetical protein